MHLYLESQFSKLHSFLKFSKNLKVHALIKFSCFPENSTEVDLTGEGGIGILSSLNDVSLILEKFNTTYERCFAVQPSAAGKPTAKFAPFIIECYRITSQLNALIPKFYSRRF